MSMPPRPGGKYGANLPGRVVRLHFECKAEIPMGCSLQVVGGGQTAPLYTTPDTYPTFRTRTPLVVNLNRHSLLKKSDQNFYYRYQLVAPPENAVIHEDPFPKTTPNNNNKTSSVSLASSTMNVAVDVPNLPYRTLEINIHDTTYEAVSDEWMNPDDESFENHRIRDAIYQDKPKSGMDTSSDTGTSTPQAFKTSTKIWFVCFHLPVVVVKSNGVWQASWSESILAKTEGSQILSTYEGYWLGTVTTHPAIASQKDQDEIVALLTNMKCIPIFLNKTQKQNHYYGFCKQVLWPAFHNIDLLDLSTCGWITDEVNSDWDQSRYIEWWEAYKNINQTFSNELSKYLKNGDIVWVHDYHLCLLPKMLTEHELQKYNMKVSRKVFFLHIPFPTSQIFRELESGEEILSGMLHSDVVGFHAFDHARHFLNAAKRILGLNYESLSGGLIGVNFQGSNVLVTMSNVSIEPRMIDAALSLNSVKAGQQALLSKHKGRIIIGGVDIGQRLSGCPLKLLAYERLLQNYPSWQKNTVMVVRLLLPGSRQADENLTTKEVRYLIQRIQRTHGSEVIDYEEVIGTSLPMDQRLALWKASDILMSTPIREGLNHWPMEFIYAHKAPEKPGIVITSEFSAVHSILNGALRVNPYDIKATITTIDKALSMELAEREGRRYRDIGFVSNSPSDKWVKNVLRDLRDAITARSHAAGSESTSQTATPFGTPNPARKLVDNSTSAFLEREASHAFARLNPKDLKKAYDLAKKRVIILDFNGTIVLKEPPGKYLKREILGTSGNKPPPEVIDALSRLCEDPRNTVYVVSGDSSENVLNALGNLSGLGLAVSNGACFSPPNERRRRWLTFDLGVDWDAVKRVALPVLSKYTARSNGSFVKLTSFSIGWSYYSCDPEWGSLQASHLVLELESELRHFDIRLVNLKGIVEIVPNMLNKGLIVRKVLQDSQDPVDFVLCFGDDISDEKMFTSVKSYIAEMDQQSHPCPRVFDERGQIEEGSNMDTSKTFPTPMYSFTVAVGKKETSASCYVNDAQEVANCLVTLGTGQVPESGVYGDERYTRMFD